MTTNKKEEEESGGLACLLESPTLWEESGEAEYNECVPAGGSCPGQAATQIWKEPHKPTSLLVVCV